MVKKKIRAMSGKDGWEELIERRSKVYWNRKVIEKFKILHKCMCIS